VATGYNIEVIGSSGVFFIDVSDAKHRETKHGIAASGIRLHYLAGGDGCNLKEKTFTVNPARPPIQKGKEYYRDSILDTNIFSKDAAYTLVTQGLIDNSRSVATGVAFTLEPTGNGNGTKLVFGQDSDTRGFWGKVNGKETYTALGVSLQIIPIRISISEIRQ